MASRIFRFPRYQVKPFLVFFVIIWSFLYTDFSVPVAHHEKLKLFSWTFESLKKS